MTPNCSFFLDNGKPCRCPALSGGPFCRHHTPEARARRRQAPLAPPPQRELSHQPPDPDTPPTPAELGAYWRIQHRHIPFCDVEALDDGQTMILHAIADHAISHRSAGRLLALIADRRAQLEREAVKAQMDALHADLLAWNNRHAIQEPRDKYPVSVPHPQNDSFEASESYPVSR